MKTVGSAGIVLLLVSGVFSQDPDPFAEPSPAEPIDAFAKAEQLEQEAAATAEPRITVLSEFIEIPLADWSTLSRSDLYANNDSALRKEIGRRMKNGEATLIDMSLVTGVNGDQTLNESFRFLIYPAEFTAPQIDEKNGRIVPAALAASECWAARHRFSANIVLGQHETVHLSISPEIQNKSGESEMGKDSGRVTQPEVAIQQIHSQLELASGAFALAGVLRATEPTRPDAGEAVLLVFVRATVDTPGL
ncbi:MAG: hypothetical protein AAF236_17410 [Verrucomicrobiota bacterium]